MCKPLPHPSIPSFELFDAFPLPVMVLKKPIDWSSFGAQQTIEFANAPFRRVFGVEASSKLLINDWLGRAYPDEAYQAWVVKQLQHLVQHSDLQSTSSLGLQHAAQTYCAEGRRRWFHFSLGELVQGQEAYQIWVLNEVNHADDLIQSAMNIGA